MFYTIIPRQLTETVYFSTRPYTYTRHFGNVSSKKVFHILWLENGMLFYSNIPRL